MADRPSRLEDVLHVAVGAAVLGVNRFHADRRRLEEWLDRLAVELASDHETVDP
jgi:hypothetical protein